MDEHKKHPPPPQLAEVVSDGGEQSIDATTFLTGKVVAIQSMVRLHVAYAQLDRRTPT